MSRGLLTFKVEAAGLQKAVAHHIRSLSPKLRERFARALMFDLLRLVINKTPVDTGRARAGWGAGADRLGIPIPAGPGASEGRALSEYREQQRGASLRITVTNRVAYIEELEYGHSLQAPLGMVRLAARELAQRLGGRLPAAIADLYARTWRTGSMPAGTELRANLIRETLGDSAARSARASLAGRKGR